MSKTNWIDKVITAISPEAGYRREIWRQGLEDLRGYDAASYGRVNAGWRVHNESAETTDRHSRDVVRARARDLERNSDIVSASVTLRFTLSAVRTAASSDTRTSPNSKPCTVEGVTYPSREAAINAYHQTRITVYSRMEREHISFEEALIRGRNSATYKPPAVSLFPSLHLISTRKPVTQPVLAELARSLEYYRCRVQPMVDLVTGLSVLLVNEHSYVYFNHEARGLEVLSELPIEADRDTLWALNGSYVAAKLFTNHLSGKIYLLSFQSAKEEEQDIKTLLNTWFSHICIRDKLLRMFEEEEQEKTG